MRAGTSVGTERGPLVASNWLPGTFSSTWISAGTVAARRGAWAGGLHWKQLHLGEVEVRDDDGVSQGTYESYEREATVAGAYDLTDRLTAGVGLRYIRLHLSPSVSGNVGSRTATTGALDLGLHYHRQREVGSLAIRPSLGWSLRNFGPNVDLEEKEPGDRPLPMTMRLGGGLQVATQDSWRGRPFFEVGLYSALSNQLTHVRTVTTADGTTYTEADGPLRTLFFSGWGTGRGQQRAGGDAAQLSVWEQTIKHAGAELRLLDVLSVRWGRFHEHELNGARQFTTHGFGLDLYYLEIEHSWTADDSSLENSFWRLTGRIPLNGDDPRNFWPAFLDAF